MEDDPIRIPCLSLIALALVAAPAKAKCNTTSCLKRVEWKRYKANPMPWCTWGPESGKGRPQYSTLRYRQPNVSGGTGGGKFQILDSTWAYFGGLKYAKHAHDAYALQQERVARRILSGQGLSAWVNC
jgi:hypothetical protein